MLRTILRSVLRAPEGESGAGGGSSGGDSGGDQTAAELAKTKAELASLKASQAEASKKLKDAETAAARANGDLAKVLEAKEAELAETRKKAEEAMGALDSFHKRDRQSKLTEAVAKKLGVAVSPVLVGLLPQTGEDISPEKITDAHVGKVADLVRKLAPDLKPNRTAAPGPSGGSDRELDQSDPGYWTNLGKTLAGR